MRGSADLHQLEQVLDDVTLVSSDDEYATIAGLLLAQHEELPRVGETFVIGAYRFEVREMSDRRIELVRITRE